MVSITVFMVNNKVGTKYSSSPYYKGTKISDALSKEIQEADSIHLFKNFINKRYKTYVKDFYI